MQDQVQSKRKIYLDSVWRSSYPAIETETSKQQKRHGRVASFEASDLSVVSNGIATFYFCDKSLEIHPGFKASEVLKAGDLILIEGARQKEVFVTSKITLLVPSSA